MYGKGVELYLAPTADARDTWQATLRHIACEGRCFVLGCNQFVNKEMYPEKLRGHPELADQPEVMCRGGSAILSPLGEVIAGPLYGEEGILLAELDLDEIVRAKLDFDVVGHYARPDVLNLNLRTNQLTNLKLTPSMEPIGAENQRRRKAIEDLINQIKEHRCTELLEAAEKLLGDV